MDTRLLDVAIGLVLVFALTSLLASIITEAIRNYSGQRGKNLKTAIASMLGDDQKLADAFYAQPLIRTLYLGERHPSYLEADLFKTGLFALLSAQLSPPLAPGQGTPQEYVNALSAAISAPAANVPNSPPSAPLPGLPTVVVTLQSLCAGVGSDWPAFEARITQWFNATGDRSIGWFTRRTQVLLFGVGLFLAGALNINAIVIASALWNDPVVRDVVARQAEVIAAERSGAGAAAGPAAAGASPGAPLTVPAGTPNTTTARIVEVRKLTNSQLDALINSLKNERSNAKIATTLMEQASILRSELDFALDAQGLQSVATTSQTTGAAIIDWQSHVDAQLKQLKALAASDAAQRLDPLLLNVVNRRIDGIENAIAIARALAAPPTRPSAAAITQKPLPTCPRPIVVPPVVAPKADTTGTDPNASTSAGTNTATADNDAAWALGKLCGLGIPMGWGEQAGPTIYPDHPVLEFFFVTLCGWVITAAACTLGAQFWFDLLGKLVKLRAAGRTPASGAPAEGDTRPARPPAAGGGSAPGSAPAPFQYALNEVERGLSEAQIRRLQQFIRMPSGEISGLLDGPTRKAIVQWHRGCGLGDSNELTAADVSQLLQDQAATSDPAPAPGAAPQASAQPLGQAHHADEDACGCDLPVVTPTLDEHLPGTRGGEQ